MRHYTKRVTVAAAYTPISPKLSKISGPALSGGVAGVETFYLIELVTDTVGPGRCCSLLVLATSYDAEYSYDTTFEVRANA